MDKSIWLSGMMGLVVGDALGTPVQFMTRDEIKNRKNGKYKGPVTGMEDGGVYGMPIGTWSDDSSMAIATLSSILEHGILDPVEVMLNFVRWEVKGEFTPFGEAFDQGGTCTQAIYDFIKLPDISECGQKGEYSNGNGSLMRIMPACLYYYSRQSVFDVDMTNETISGIETVSGLTHNHLRSRIACGLYYFMVKEIIENKDKDLLEILQNAIDKGLKYYGENISVIPELKHFTRIFKIDAFKNLKESDIKSSGYVIDSLEAAIWCLINTDSFESCLIKAVNLGDDTDTVGAIAGGLAGLYYGYDDIPTDWISVIQRQEWIEDLCAKAEKELFKLEHGIVDLHMHVIPGVDDGAENMEMSLAMLRESYLQGVRKIFCTSHGGVYMDEDGMEQAILNFKELRKLAKAEMPDLSLYLGAEVCMFPQYLKQILALLEDDMMPTLNGSKYVLTEYYNAELTVDDIEKSLDMLLEAGFIPIIAHMERYFEVIPSVEHCKRLHDKGVYFQVNGYSVTDEHRKEVRDRAKELLDAGLVDFIGSDAHRVTHRPPRMIKEVKYLYKHYDKEYVDKMVFKNAEIILGD